MKHKQYDATAYSQNGFKAARIWLPEEPKAMLISLGPDIAHVQYYFSNERNQLRDLTRQEANKIVCFRLAHFPPVEVDPRDRFNTIIRPEHAFWTKNNQNVIQQCPKCKGFLPVMSPFTLLQCGECRGAATMQKVNMQKACGISPLTPIMWEEHAIIMHR